MSVESTIHGRLAGYSGLTALVSTRIYPIIIPQNGSVPAVVYQTIDASYEPMNGYSNDGCIRTAMQIDAYDDDYPGVKAVADQIRAALMDWHQDTSPIIWRVTHIGEGDAPFESDTKLFRVSFDFEVLSPA